MHGERRSRWEQAGGMIESNRVERVISASETRSVAGEHELSKSERWWLRQLGVHVDPEVAVSRLLRVRARRLGLVAGVRDLSPDEVDELALQVRVRICFAGAVDAGDLDEWMQDDGTYEYCPRGPAWDFERHVLSRSDEPAVTRPESEVELHRLRILLDSIDIRADRLWPITEAGVAAATPEIVQLLVGRSPILAPPGA